TMTVILLNMASISAFWFFVFFALSGIGMEFLRLSGNLKRGCGQVFLGFWIGWSFLIVVLQIWHFFLPITSLTFWFWICTGLFCQAGFVRKNLSFKNTTLKEVALYTAIITLFTLWLSNRALSYIGPTDAGLYHLNAIRWISEYPVIPGLGNVHIRLGFNVSHFLYMAFIGSGPCHHVHNVANGLLLWVTASMIILRFFKIFRNPQETKPHHFLEAFFLIPVIHQCFKNSFTTSTDLPISLLGVLICVRTAKILFDTGRLKDLSFDFILVVFFSAIAITLKVNFIVLGGLYVLVAFVRCIHLGRREKVLISFMPTIAIVTVGTGLIFVPWVVRGVILNGYLLFPSPFLSFPVDWKVPFGDVHLMMRYVQSWCRAPHKHPDEVLGNWNWFIPWLKRIVKDKFNIVLPIKLFFVSSLLSVMKKEKTPALRTSDLLLLVPPLGNLLFLFVLSPHPRYAGFTFWLLGSSSFIIAMRRWGVRNISISAPAFTVLVVGITILTHISENRLIIIPRQKTGHYKLPKADLVIQKTKSGLTVFTPRHGDRCWNSPLPCTPYFNPDLQLRVPGDFSQGFFIPPNAPSRVFPKKKW
ncbi:MAG: LIC_10190 family membrane protein, partial [Nitrospinota bacterium]